MGSGPAVFFNSINQIDQKMPHVFYLYDKEKQMNTAEDIGKYLRTLRNKRGISRAELAEMVGISQSHLEKIENGQRSPGMPTFWKIIEILNKNQSIQEKCVSQIQEIILHCTEEKAVYLTKILIYMSENLDTITT